MARPLLDSDDQQRIEQAIAELERRSAIELVVMVVPRSSAYSGWRALGAGLWALGAALLGVTLLPPDAAVWAVLAQAPIALLGYALFGSGAFARWLIADRDFERAVTARAYQLFTECGIHETREGTGILLLLSELEHRAVLLGDRAVHRLLGEAGWQTETERLVAHVRAGRAVDGVLELIADLSNQLVPALPRAGDDVNELPNQVQRRD